MTALHLKGVGFAWPARPPLLESIDVHLTPGWTGIVGANGAGKSTLLSLMDGSLTPTTGVIHRQPAGLTIARCHQQVDDCTDAIYAFAWDWSRHAVRQRATLRLDPDVLDRWSSLSPGERRRWQIGAALAADPGVLLLDEPANHLDADGRARMMAALSRFGGIGVVVSHDRALLDELTTATAWVADRAVELIGASYSAAAEIRAAARSQRLTRLAEDQRRDRAARARLDDLRRQRDEGAARRRRQMKDKNDRDARSAGAKARATKAEARNGRRTRVVRRMSDELRSRAAGHALRAEHGRDIAFDYSPPPVATLAALDVPTITAGERVLLRDVRLAVGRHDRVRIAGPNGVGKSTLLRHLMRTARGVGPRCLILPQHITRDAGAEALSAIKSMPVALRGRTLQRVAALGLDPDRLLQSARPSPGETRKLLLARGLALEPWWIVMDEPTHHLDLPSRLRLQAALAAWPGALLLISHDRAFAEALTTIEWRLGDGRVEVR